MTYEQVKEYNEKIYKEIDKLNAELNSMSDEDYDIKRKEYRVKIDNLFSQLKSGEDITEKSEAEKEEEKQINDNFAKLEEFDKKRLDKKRDKLIEMVGNDHEDVKHFDDLVKKLTSIAVLNKLLNEIIAMNTNGIKHIHYSIENMATNEFVKYAVLETSACGYLKIFANIPQTFDELPRIIKIVVEA